VDKAHGHYAVGEADIRGSHCRERERVREAIGCRWKPAGFDLHSESRHHRLKVKGSVSKCEGYSGLAPRRYSKETLLRVQRLKEPRGLLIEQLPPFSDPSKSEGWRGLYGLSVYGRSERKALERYDGMKRSKLTVTRQQGRSSL
jgi:hypothetical protein